MLKRGFQFTPGYRLQEFLGRGQFGQVWRATAPGGAAAAIKFIDLSDGQGQKEYDGVRRVKQIRHANLMPITAIWLLDAQGQVIEEAENNEAVETIELSEAEARGQSALLGKPEVEPSWLAVSMLLGGMSLQKRLQECVADGLPGIPPKELIAYMDESAKGIDFLNSPQHDLGEGPISIQHSDIKPANIVLIGSSAVVCDFGLARILTRNQVTATSAAGTPAYMAPEAISGKPARSSDQYSLAVTYYHLRTGTLPVNDGSLWEVLDAHRHGNLKLGLVPEAEQQVLKKATDLDWEKRFDTNLDMVDALRDALRAEGTTKPSFVPSGGSTPTAAASGNNSPELAATSALPSAVDSVGDPTATIDLATAEKPADDTGNVDQSLTETQPFVQTETPTEQGFLQATTPSLDEASGTNSTADSSFNWKSPKMMMGAGAGLAGLILLTAITLGAFGPGEDSNPQPDPTPVPVVITPPVEEPPAVDPNQLFEDAIAAFSSDEKSAVEQFARAIDLDSKLAFLNPLELARSHKGAVMKLEQSQNGKELFSIADDPAVFLWRLGDQEDLVASVAPALLSGHKSALTSLAISSNSERLLTGSYSDSNARVWDLTLDHPEANPLELNMQSGDVLTVAWHPTELIALTGTSNDELGVWQIGRGDEQHPTGKVEKEYKISLDYEIKSVEIDPAGNWIAVRPGGFDNMDIRLYRWNEIANTLLQSGTPEPIMLGAPEAKHVRFLSGSGSTRIVSADNGGGVTIYKLPEAAAPPPQQQRGSRRSAAPAQPLSESRLKVAHSLAVDAIRVVNLPDRDFIVTGSADGSVHWWNRSSTSDQKLGRSLGDQAISSVDVSTDGRWLAAGTGGGNVWLWDTEVGEESGAINFVTGSSSVDAVTIDPAGRWLIAGCDDGVIRLWDLTIAKLLAKTKPTSLEAPLIEREITIDAKVSMR